MSPLSCRVFVWMYWFMHCKFFQEHSQAEQIHLLQRLSRTYSQVCGLPVALRNLYDSEL